MNSFWISLFLFMFSAPAFAHQPEEGKVLGTIGPFFSQTQANYSHDISNSPVSPGFGLLAEGDLSHSGGLEIGLFYREKTFQRVFPMSTHLVEHVYKLSVPLGYRYWITNWFSAGLAFSASYSMGPSFVTFNNSNTVTDWTSAEDGTEYLIDASLQWEAWTNKKFTVLIDGRYMYSLSAKFQEDANEYGVMVGLKYMIQEHGSEVEK